MRRRTLLRRGLAAAGVAGVGTLAGCQADEGADGGDGDQSDGDGGTANTTASGPQGPAWATWLFDPTDLVDVQVHGFATYDVAELLSYRDSAPEEIDDGIDQVFGQVEYLSADDLDRLSVQGFGQATLGVGGDEQETPAGWNGVATGSFDAEVIAGELSDSDAYSEAGEYGGFRLFEGPPDDESASAAVAVGSEAVLGGGAVDYDLGPTAVVERAIDADAGDAARYYGAGDVTAALLDRHGDATTAFGAVDPEGAYAELLADAGAVDPQYEELLRASRGLGRSTTLGEDTTSTLVSLQFSGEGSGYVSDVRSLVEQARDRTRQNPFGEFQVSADGRAVLVSASGDTDAILGNPTGLAFVAPEAAVVATFLLGLDQQQEPAPQVAFEYERRSDGRVVVTHTGGDTVERLQVVYVADGEEFGELWRSEDGIAAGDSFTTSRAPDGGTSLRVVWEGEQRAATLGVYRVPES